MKQVQRFFPFLEWLQAWVNVLFGQLLGAWLRNLDDLRS